MAPRLPSTALAAVLALGLLAAPASAQTAPDEDAPAIAPDGNGCAAAVARWQDFSARESREGHMDLSVYEQVQNEIDRADHLCQAGQDAQARRAIAGSRRRHGYPS